MIISRKVPLIASLSMMLIGAIATEPASALTFNPINSALPLTIHARASCLGGFITLPDNQAHTTVNTVDRATTASCADGVLAQGSTSSISSSDTVTADLATGTLKAVVTARGVNLGPGVDSPGAGAFADGYLYDTLTVNGNWTGTKIVELRLAVDGAFITNASVQNWQGTNVSSSLLLLTQAGTLLGNAGLIITQGNNGTPFITASGANVATLTTNAVNTVFDPNNVQFTLSFLFPATTSNRTFSFLGRLFVISGGGGGGPIGTIVEGTVDFGNTGRFSLIVPSDVTITSASGQFLTAVPLPSAWWMLGGAMTLVTQRKRRAKAG